MRLLIVQVIAISIIKEIEWIAAKKWKLSKNAAHALYEKATDETHNNRGVHICEARLSLRCVVDWRESQGNSLINADLNDITTALTHTLKHERPHTGFLHASKHLSIEQTMRHCLLLGTQSPSASLLQMWG